MSEHRHNEHTKMEIRIKSEKHKTEQLQTLGEQERANMEKLSRLKFRIALSYIFKPPAKYSSFTVFLHAPLSEEEIKMRMMKGFGDM